MLIATPSELEAFCRSLAGETVLALDTEFRWERTYFAELGLIQIATRERVGLIDCVALPDLSALRPIIVHPGILKVLHGASQDAAILKRIFGASIAGLFDSQIAAALAGLGYQVGYGRLIQALLGVELDKSVQYTDWLQRPLSPAQLAYAEADVRHLATIFPILDDRLRRLGRLAWVVEDSEALAHDPAMEATEPGEAHHGVANRGRLNRRQLYRLHQLAAWRERHGRAANLRPRWAVPDPLLVHLASRGVFPEHFPATDKPWQVRRVYKLRSEIEPVLRQANEVPDHALPHPPVLRPLTPVEKRRVEQGMQWLAVKGESLGVDRSALAARSDVVQLVRGLQEQGRPPGDSRLLRGWRAKEVGQPLVEALTQTVVADDAEGPGGVTRQPELPLSSVGESPAAQEPAVFATAVAGPVGGGVVEDGPDQEKESGGAQGDV